MTVNSVDSSSAPQVVEIWYWPLTAFERTVAVPKSRHGWCPSGLPFNAPMSSTGECTTPTLSRQARSSDTVEPGVPRWGVTRNQFAPGAAVVGVAVGSEGSAVALGSTVRLGDELGRLGSTGLAAPEHAAPKTPSTTTLAMATPLRTPITAAVCRKPGQRSMPATGLR
jgi:hypothetical protein